MKGIQLELTRHHDAVDFEHSSARRCCAQGRARSRPRCSLARRSPTRIRGKQLVNGSDGVIKSGIGIVTRKLMHLPAAFEEEPSEHPASEKNSSSSARRDPAWVTMLLLVSTRHPDSPASRLWSNDQLVRLGTTCPYSGGIKSWELSTCFQYRVTTWPDSSPVLPPKY